MTRILFCLALIASSTGCATNPVGSCPVSLVVLGTAQDGGKPQIGRPDDPAWDEPQRQRYATSVALVDKRAGQTRRWLFEATPDIKPQLQMLDRMAPANRALGIDGIFLTHAHIGHYSGLMQLGHEAAGAKDVPVYAMPRMAAFLTANGPWGQLLRYGNIALRPMTNGRAVDLGGGRRVTPLLVPHRQEYSEVVGFRIDGPLRSALFLPDIDSWEQWDAAGTRIEDVIASVDIALLDATFFADGELPGRDMSGFPHPFVSHSMARFANLPATEKRKIRFIHLNHSNPLHDADSEQYKAVKAAGFDVAQQGGVLCL